jgi:hypothetical protein
MGHNSLPQLINPRRDGVKAGADGDPAPTKHFRFPSERYYPSFQRDNPGAGLQASRLARGRTHPLSVGFRAKATLAVQFTAMKNYFRKPRMIGNGRHQHATAGLLLRMRLARQAPPAGSSSNIAPARLK